MRVAILSRNAALASTQKLLEAGARRGHEVQVIDYLRCYMNITALNPTVMYQGQTLWGFDAVIPRVGASYTCYGSAVVRQFEIMGVFCANGADAIARAHDKLGCLQLLAQRGIGLPGTGVAHSSKDLRSLIETIGGAPLVVKLLADSHGAGAILAESPHAAESVIEAFQGLEADSLIQRFIAEAAGQSLRALVIGSKVVAAMRRTAPAGEFRSNLHRGGKAEKAKLSKQERRVAIDAARVMGLKIAGVDLLRSDSGPLVMAVNSTPELEAIEAVTGVHVAGKLFEYLEAELQPPVQSTAEPPAPAPAADAPAPAPAITETQPYLPALGL